MRAANAHTATSPDRYLLLADTGEEDVAELITVITEQSEHSTRRFDHLDGIRFGSLQ